MQVAEQVHACDWTGDDSLVETELYTILASVALNKHDQETVGVVNVVFHGLFELPSVFTLLLGHRPHSAAREHWPRHSPPLVEKRVTGSCECSQAVVVV